MNDKARLIAVGCWLIMLSLWGGAYGQEQLRGTYYDEPEFVTALMLFMVGLGCIAVVLFGEAQNKP